MARRWTDEEHHELVEMMVLEFENKEILAKLDRSPAAIACKIHELRQKGVLPPVGVSMDDFLFDNRDIVKIDLEGEEDERDLVEFNDSDYVELMRKLVVYYFGGCLAVAGILALVWSL